MAASSVAQVKAERGPSVGRKILRVVAGGTVVGGFAADWNRTHLFNPGWPPHARFHDAQTIAVGAFLGMGALRALNRKGPELQRDTAVPGRCCLHSSGRRWERRSDFLALRVCSLSSLS